MAGGDPIPVEAVAQPKTIMETRKRIADLYMDDRIVDYIVDIVHATREPKQFGLDNLLPLVEFGASPRATISLAQASRAHAFLRLVERLRDNVADACAARRAGPTLTSSTLGNTA